MNKALTRLGCSLLFISAILLGQTAPLPRGTPESQGVASTALLQLVALLDSQIDNLHSLLIVRRGHVIAEGWWAPYHPRHNHVLYSLSKSFTSTAVGFAVTEGRISINDEILSFFPEHAPDKPSPNLKAMRLRDLLTMSTGHQDEPPAAPDAISTKSFLSWPVPHLPGTHFKYNTPATFVQSAIVQKVTGQTVLDYLRPRLFEPLGIEHPVWDTNFEGISLGGYGLRVRTEDIAKFGQLYLQRGAWNGQQLLPASWIESATARQVSNGSNPNSDWNQGYGFQFWRCRHNAFRGDGAFGQYCVVLPDQDVVVAITSGVRDMQAVLNLLWDILLPACQPQPLPPDQPNHRQLLNKLAGLTITPAQGNPSTTMADRILNRRFAFTENDQNLESLTLVPSSDADNLTFAARIAGQSVTIPCGHRRWLLGRAPVSVGVGRISHFPDEPVAGSFAWQSDDALEIKVCAYETPFLLTFRLKFDDHHVTFDSDANVAFGPTQRPQLIGRAD
jgi:CubicO group peptidase (beta-lactamase class C family)